MAPAKKVKPSAAKSGQLPTKSKASPATRTFRISSTTGANQLAAAPRVEEPSSVRTFRALLEPDHTSLKWVIARIPFNVADTWSSMRRLRVRGEINGFAFRTSLFPSRADQPGHFLLVNRRMQAAAGVGPGAYADLSLEPDLEERPSAIPPELKAAFQGDRKLLRYVEAMSESMRTEIGKWIHGVKGSDSRSRRSAQMAERLLLAMEGEQEMPSVLQSLFAKTPRARAGWEAMTVSQRRSHLLGIFYYQTPEARIRRAEKAVEDAMRIRDKAINLPGS